VLVAASGAGDFGTLNAVEPGVELALGALLGPLRFELSGTYWAAQAVSDPEHPADGTTIHWLEGGLRGCFRGRLSDRLELDPCLGAALVYASSDGFGPTTTFTAYQATPVWGALRADALAAWRLVGPLGLRASAGIDVPLAPPTFVVDVTQQGQTTRDRLLQPSPIAARATLGVEVRFP
jgi:hypothetical protein